MKEPCVHDFELTDFYSSCLLPLLLMYHTLKLQKLSDHIKYYEAVYKIPNFEIQQHMMVDERFWQLHFLIAVIHPSVYQKKEPSIYHIPHSEHYIGNRLYLSIV